jgi:hypothetical protein
MWLHIPPSTGSNCARASVGLDLLSPSQCQAIAPSVTWRGKSVLPQALSRRWKQGGFIRLLSGLTLEVSTQNSCAASWISSLRATRASPTASRATGKAIRTNASSSIRCFASLTKAGLILCSGKMSPAMQTGSLPRSSRHWKQWAAALRLEYSARPKPGTAIGGKDYSSWRSEHDHAGLKVTAASHQGALMKQASLWPGPRSSDAIGGGVITDAMTGTSLAQQVGGMNWSSPTVRIHKGGGTALTRADGKSRLDMLDWQAESWEPSQVETSPISSCPSQAIGGGEASLTDIPNSNQPSPKRKLNPIFVEALMRWPIGLSGFDTAATAFLHLSACLASGDDGA